MVLCSHRFRSRKVCWVSNKEETPGSQKFLLAKNFSGAKRENRQRQEQRLNTGMSPLSRPVKLRVSGRDDVFSFFNRFEDEVRVSIPGGLLEGGRYGLSSPKFWGTSPQRSLRRPRGESTMRSGAPDLWQRCGGLRLRKLSRSRTPSVCRRAGALSCC